MPWTRDGTIITTDGVQIDIRLDDDGNWVSVKGDKPEVVKANADLILAIPALLEAARNLAHRLVELEAAIAQAEGK